MKISKIEKVQLNQYTYFYSVEVRTDAGELVSIQHFNDGTVGKVKLFSTGSGLHGLLYTSEREFLLFHMVKLDTKKFEDFC